MRIKLGNLNEPTKSTKMRFLILQDVKFMCSFSFDSIIFLYSVIFTLLIESVLKKKTNIYITKLFLKNFKFVISAYEDSYFEN